MLFRTNRDDWFRSNLASNRFCPGFVETLLSSFGRCSTRYCAGSVGPSLLALSAGLKEERRLFPMRWRPSRAQDEQGSSAASGGLLHACAGPETERDCRITYHQDRFAKADTICSCSCYTRAFLFWPMSWTALSMQESKSAGGVGRSGVCAMPVRLGPMSGQMPRLSAKARRTSPKVLDIGRPPSQRIINNNNDR